MGMITVSPAGMTHVALFWASRVQEMSNWTLPDAEMVLPLVQSHCALGLKSMVAVLVAALLSPTLLKGRRETGSCVSHYFLTQGGGGLCSLRRV